jgi:hypothetical protein
VAPRTSARPTGSWSDSAEETRLGSIGKYTLLLRLGGGGQATTYLAFDPDLRRHVVLKLYHRALSLDEQEVVLKEGRSLARVHSPFVAQCHTAERHEGVPYLVVEHVPGRSLAEVLRAGRVPLDRAMEMTRQVAEGLAAVHACGLLHRDIKPANILVGEDGLPRLIDFGLAEPVVGGALGHVSGTPPYMAPEQARGEAGRIDARSDVFGLGATLYELLTGQPPFRAPTLEETLQAAKAGDVVPAGERNPALPTSVAALCMRCLEKEPARRFASAAELVVAIRQWQRARSWWARGLAALGVAALLAVAFAVYLAATRRDPPPAPELAKVPENTGSVTNGKKDPPRGGAIQHPKGWPLRQDFALKVAVVDKPGSPGAGPTVRAAGADGKYHFVAGERFLLRIEPGRDAFVGVWFVDDQKNVVQLFPNRRDTDPFVRGGEVRLVPTDPRLALEATESEGFEYIYIVAATRGWAQPVAVRAAGAEGVYDVVKEEDLDSLVRGLRLVEDGPEKLSEAVLPITVRAVK